MANHNVIISIPGASPDRLRQLERLIWYALSTHAPRNSTEAIDRMRLVLNEHLETGETATITYLGIDTKQ
jgi:hypothetical protein